MSLDHTVAGGHLGRETLCVAVPSALSLWTFGHPTVTCHLVIEAILKRGEKTLHFSVISEQGNS